MALAGSAFLVWGWQVFVFARDGVWPALSASAALYRLTGIEWFSYPTAWYGIHRALDWLNAGVAAWIPFFVAGAVAGAVEP